MSNLPAEKKLSKRAQTSKFIALTATAYTLYALDNNGRVWQYHTATEKAGGGVRFAFWGGITTHRAAPTALTTAARIKE